MVSIQAKVKLVKSYRNFSRYNLEKLIQTLHIIFLIDLMKVFLTSKFELTLGNIKIENIILTPIWATIFFKVLALLDVKHCP